MPLVLAGFLVHVTWLRSTYQAMRGDGFSFRTPDALQHRLWLIWLSDVLYAILFVWLYVRGREDTPWIRQGFRYGVLRTLPISHPSRVPVHLPSCERGESLPLETTWCAPFSASLLISCDPDYP